MPRGLLEAIRTELGRRSRHTLDGPGWRRASVLVPVYLREDELYLLFTKRTEHLPHHKGQICFPGGGQHAHDTSPQETALREAQEEVGIHAADVEILGALDDIEVPPSRYLVTPIVGRIPYPYPFLVNREEITELIHIPLAALLNPRNVRREVWEADGAPFSIYFYSHGAHTVWGATARILRQFIEVVAGLPREGPRPTGRPRQFIRRT